jgi:hypothetical protein
MNEKRILSYVTGLLYFYGVMDFEGLYRAVSENLPVSLDRDTLKAVLDKEVVKEDSPYEFDFDEGFYIHFDVDDPDWVLEEQEARSSIPYRPVSEKEANFIVDEHYSSLWNYTAKKVYRLLQEKYDRPEGEALEMILESQELFRNGMPPMELVQDFMSDIEYRGLEEVQPLADMVMEMTNNTPLWILKGWTPHEVFERFERPALKLLPDKPFEFEDTAEKKVPPKVKVGRNEPCPCGSGKKYKKCCGAPVSEEEDERLSPPPAPGKDAPARIEVPAWTEPTLEEWSALYEATVDIKKAKCWEWMYDDDLFGVLDPETGEIAYCCIMGSLGKYYGLGAYLGAEGLGNVWDMLSNPDDEDSPEGLFKQKCLMVSFLNRDDLTNEDRAIIKNLGLKFRGKNQWPEFRSFEPGLYPWKLSAWECRFLTLVLQQALEVSLRCRGGKAILEHNEPFTFLVRVPREQVGLIEWVDRYLKAVPSEVEEYPSFKMIDELRLRRILASRKKSEGTWETDTFFMHYPVQDGKKERPYYPKIFLILDGSTGLILRHELMKNIWHDGYLCIEAILQLVGDKGVFPSRIMVEREETYYLLEDACRQLNISLEMVEQLKLMPEVREEMMSGKWRM